MTDLEHLLRRRQAELRTTSVPQVAADHRTRWDRVTAWVEHNEDNVMVGFILASVGFIVVATLLLVAGVVAIVSCRA